MDLVIFGEYLDCGPEKLIKFGRLWLGLVSGDG